MPQKTAVKEKTGAENITWDLSDLFDSITDDRITRILEKAPKEAKVFRDTYKEKVSQLTEKDLCTAFQSLEQISINLYKVSQYVHLLYAVDTADETIKATVQQVEEVCSRVDNELLFFTLELGKLPDKNLIKLAKAPVLKNYKYKLEHLSNKAQYFLSEKEEQMVNLKDLTGIQALRKLYTDLTSSFEFEMEVEGQKRKMNGSELRSLRQHEDPQVRQNAMRLFFNRYKDNQLIIGSVFNSITKDYNVERELRGYRSPISVMNSGNDLDDKAIEVLHQVTTESFPLVNRYYHLKRKILGLKKLTLADIYAPMPNHAKKYQWNEAKKLVLDSFKAFDLDFYKCAQKMFDENRVDARMQPKKRGGAFCSSSVPGLDPYVLLNFLGRSRDVSTMAHEFGHAIHAMYSHELPLWSYHAILPLCETASVFCEMVLMDAQRKSETDPMAKQVILTDKLEDLFATSHRQNMFSKFEMAVHEKIGERYMSPDELCQTYEEGLKEMFGDAVSYTDEYRWEWASIPHIFEVPYYVHSYNFGNLLVLALYQQYLEEGQSFIPKLKTMLSLGRSVSPKEMTSAIGVDINSASFWRKSLVYIESLVDELEDLVNKN